jgi:hypothetical protein
LSLGGGAEAKPVKDLGDFLEQLSLGKASLNITDLDLEREKAKGDITKAEDADRSMSLSFAKTPEKSETGCINAKKRRAEQMSNYKE